jgi:hypothetical protein
MLTRGAEPLFRCQNTDELGLAALHCGIKPKIHYSLH